MNDERLNDLHIMAFEHGKVEQRNMCAEPNYEAIISEYEKQIKEVIRLNNIINELEEWCNNGIKNGIHIAYEQELDYEDVLDKLKELKEGNK